MSIPEGFQLYETGKTVCVLAVDEADRLLALGIGDIESLLKGPDVGEFRGRTTVHSVPLDGDRRMVIRRYSHGGALRKITGDKFIGPGRFLSEIAVTLKAISAGVNAPVPLGVVYEKKLALCRGDHLSVEIPDAISVLEKSIDSDFGDSEEGESGVPKSAEYLGKALYDIGELVRKLHDSGVYHADLHIKNILDTRWGYYLIDFDGARSYDILNPKLRIDNLYRLLRSIEKFLGRKVAEACFKPAQLFHCYEKHSPVLGVSVEKFVEAYEKHVARHRTRWEKSGGGYGS